MESTSIGDEKPSQFLHRLQFLSNTAVSESLMRSLWISRLPPAHQPIMVMMNCQTLQIPADIPYKVYAALPLIPSIAEATLDIQTSCLSAAEVNLNQQVQQLLCLLAEMNRVDSLRAFIQTKIAMFSITVT